MHGKAILAALLAAAMLLTGSASADRGKNWEATIQLIGTASDSSDGENGSSIDLDSATGWAFGITYNFNEHLALGFDASFVKPDYTAVIVPDSDDEDPFSISHRASIFNGAVNGTYNILKGNFTPYVQLGLGWTNVDSNVADGPPTTGCWWDPWWGYICTTTWSTYDTTEFTYNLGLGLRWDINAAFFSRASYTREFIKVDSGSLDFDAMTLEFGLMW